MDLESEKDTEPYLRSCMLMIGGDCLKWVCPEKRGMPDKICLFPNGLTIYVEVKSEGVKPKDHQLRRHTEMRLNGHIVYVLDTKAKVDRMIQFHNVPFIKTYGELNESDIRKIS